jgi:hypothetical protein
MTIRHKSKMMENIYTIKCQKKISVTIFILDKVPQNEEWYHEGYFIAIKKLIHQGHIINSVYTPAMYWIVTPPTKSSYVEIMYPFVWLYWSGLLKKWSGLSEVMSVEPCSVRPVISFSFFFFLVFFQGGLWWVWNPELGKHSTTELLSQSLELVLI